MKKSNTINTFYIPQALLANKGFTFEIEEVYNSKIKRNTKGNQIAALSIMIHCKNEYIIKIMYPFSPNFRDIFTDIFTVSSTSLICDKISLMA